MFRFKNLYSPIFPNKPAMEGLVFMNKQALPVRYGFPTISVVFLSNDDSVAVADGDASIRGYAEQQPVNRGCNPL
jgi:hypothetical protein